MKIRIFVVLACALLFFSAEGLALADEISEMKEQIKSLQETINTQQRTIEALSGKIQGVEAKQEAQAKEVKKVPELAQKIGELKEQPAGKGLFEGVTVGGHLKFALLDRTQGKRNGVDQHTKVSGGFFGNDNLFLTFGKELADWLKIDVSTKTDVAASATPSIGSDIGRVSSTSTSTSIYQAFLTARLPRQFELRAGKFNPLFSEEYAKETWWHELQNLPVKLCTLQAWHDTGVELYRNFDFDKWSLPVYFYVLNGGTDQNVDNNENKTILLHVAPELFQSKLRLLGSFAYGKWDDKGKNDVLKAAYGLDWKYRKFNLRGEYIYITYNNVVIPKATAGLANLSPTADGKREGYWVKAIYTFNPKWRALIQEGYTNLYAAGLTTGQKDMLSDKWYTTTLAVDYSLMPSSTIIGQYERGNGHRSDGSESLKFDRFTIGWRTTF